MSDYVRRVAVDFDGVIHQFTTPWIRPSEIPDPPTEGCAVALAMLIMAYDEVVIYSCRAETSAGRQAIEDYMHEHSLPYTSITDKKPVAEVYIDDRAVRFEGNWPSVLHQLPAKPWNR